MGDPAGRIDRAALERIIQRAAELQTAERDIAEHLSPAEVLALGQDVGIPDRYLRQAMLEEQTRLPDQPQTGFWDRLAGPALVGTGRVIRGDPAVIERTLLPGASAGSRSEEFPPRSGGPPPPWARARGRSCFRRSSS
jgi:hypothetical protein